MLQALMLGGLRQTADEARSPRCHGCFVGTSRQGADKVTRRSEVRHKALGVLGALGAAGAAEGDLAP
ncbi:hypothetical protein NDU88_007401 [Pleurodeles waltl]|uniref:Uncharacterized protein n=1 Tax=Pleurodeles waltl TaxID=8319 RepID=A0AAV7N1Y5_PLEWA|nr:hypothetical protein NDU88_007401 [Pleurodeles waltl]